jgi:hypothetical protein
VVIFIQASFKVEIVKNCCIDMLCNVKIGTVFTYLILLKIGVTGCTVSCNYPQNLNEKDELSCQK